MRQLRLGLAQLNPTVGDLAGNHARAVVALERARAQGVDLLAFPEMMITGYPPEDLLLKPRSSRKRWRSPASCFRSPKA
jgi:NAD+ synthase (glutamine-hydrolysing)